MRDYATRRFWGVHDEALVSREMAESVLGFHLMCAEKRIPIARESALCSGKALCEVVC